MARSKRVGLLLMGMLLWAGLCPFGSQAPLASQRQDDEFAWRAEIPPRGESEEICSQVGQPMTILFVAPSGKAVKKGDLLVELDASPLVDRRIQQVLDTQKAESEMILAMDSMEMDQRAATGQIELAEKALRLTRSQLKAFTEGEYPHQLALAEGAAAIAKQKQLMMEGRVMQLRADVKTGADPAQETALQEAEIAWREAQMQAVEAEGSLAILKSSFHDNKVAELELALAQREFDLARAKDAQSSTTLRGKQTVSFAEMSYKTESHRLAKLDDQIGRSKIHAPRDGTVMYPSDADEGATKPGATVYDRQVLLRLLPVTPPKP